MALKKITENPLITDTILFELTTTNSAGTLVNPYRVDTVVVYFIERDFAAKQSNSYTDSITDEFSATTYYSNAVAVKVFGNPEMPAWLSTDTANALIEQDEFDDDGNALTGYFLAQWIPQLAREGDYFVCWTWTTLAGGDKLSAHQIFSLGGDTQATTSIPTHFTVANKYESLLDTYLPDMFKIKIGDLDLTPSILDRFNKAMAKSFTSLEDLANQLVDLLDANATHEAFLPYLANLFKHKLRSNDPTLWRRQIKRSVPMYKAKGTLRAFKEALATSGITFQKITHYWQVVSQSTWQDGFVITDPDVLSFTLSNTAIAPIDALNFSLSIRFADTDEYIPLTSDYVSFSTTDSVTTMQWLGENLSVSPIILEENDVLLVLYKVAPVTNQSLEDYIRSLPLADLRDEVTTTFPPKNWNVRLIAEDDAMFDVVVAARHPFEDPVVWGKVRTEFPYSENIYNMEEFNGSLRDSLNPCDINKDFTDSCNACRSSYVTVDLEIEDLSNDRVQEASEVVKEFMPFHSQIYSLNYDGGVNEFVPPPVEEVEVLIQMTVDENVIVGQNDFNRIAQDGGFVDELTRDILATSSTAATRSDGLGKNDDIVLFDPAVRFDALGLDVVSNTFLEILSGANVGTYQVETPGNSVVRIVPASPSSITYPLSASSFAYRLSNYLYNDLTATITQDDLVEFEDDGVVFRDLTLLTTVNSATPWKLVVVSGVYAGTYTIADSLPNDALVLTGWTGTTSTTGLNYKITNNAGTTVIVDRVTAAAGFVTVTRRARIKTGNMVDDWGVKVNDYIRYSGNDYQIAGFKAADEAYVLGYTGGNVAGASVTVYRRLVGSGVGYLDVRGMYITTAVNHKTALSVQDRGTAGGLDNDNYKENYLVKIGSTYYQITDWSGTRIDIAGPKLTWGLAGTTVSYSLIKFVRTADVVADDVGITFPHLDRSGEDYVTYTVETTGMSMSAMAALMNSSSGGGQVIDTMNQQESVTFEIQWLDDGNTTSGQII